MHIVTVPRPLYTLNSLIPKNKFKMTLSDSDSDCSSSSDDESTGGLGSFMARQQARKDTLHQFEGFEDDDEGTVADQMRAVLALRASLVYSSTAHRFPKHAAGGSSIVPRHRKRGVVEKCIRSSLAVVNPSESMRFVPGYSILLRAAKQQEQHTGSL